MKPQIEISYSFGYVFDKSKLIVMYPMGSTMIDKDDYEMEVEVAFLEDGIEAAFNEEDIIKANDFIKPLHTYLLKPNKIIPFVTSIKDASTNEEIKNALNSFDEEYEIKDSYIRKGYEFEEVENVFKDISRFIPNNDVSTLSILKANINNFDLQSLIKESKENLDDVMDEENVVISLEETAIFNRLFVRNNDKEDIKYIRFAVFNNSQIICSNKDIITNLDIDMGDLEINNIRDVGYIVSINNDEIDIKIGNFDLTPTNTQIVQLLDYSGVLKTMMIEFIKKFIK